MSNESYRVRHALVVRDSVTVEGAFVTLFMAIFIWIIAVIAYATTRDLEPTAINCITHYCLIDSNSYRVHVFLAVLFSIGAMCCFRITKTRSSIEMDV